MSSDRPATANALSPVWPTYLSPSNPSRNLTIARLAALTRANWLHECNNHAQLTSINLTDPTNNCRTTTAWPLAMARQQRTSKRVQRRAKVMMPCTQYEALQARCQAWRKRGIASDKDTNESNSKGEDEDLEFQDKPRIPASLRSICVKTRSTCSSASFLLNLWTSVVFEVKVIYHLWMHWDSSVVFSHHTFIAFGGNWLVAGLSSFAVLFPSIGSLLAVGHLVSYCNLRCILALAGIAAYLAICPIT